MFQYQRAFFRLLFCGISVPVIEKPDDKLLFGGCPCLKQRMKMGQSGAADGAVRIVLQIDLQKNSPRCQREDISVPDTIRCKDWKALLRIPGRVPAYNK